MGKVKRLTMIFWWNQLIWAVTLEVTNLQSPSRTLQRKSQSNHET